MLHTNFLKNNFLYAAFLVFPFSLMACGQKSEPVAMEYPATSAVRAVPKADMTRAKSFNKGVMSNLLLK